MSDDSRINREEHLRIYAAYADHPSAPQVCRFAKAELDRLAASGPDLDRVSPPLVLEPTDPRFPDATRDDPPPLELEPSSIDAEAAAGILIGRREDDTPTDEPTSDQLGLFGEVGLPAVAKVAGPVQTIYVHFEDLAELEPFGRLIGQPVTTQTRYIRFPIGAEYFKAWREDVPPARGSSGEEDEEEVDLGGPAQPNLFGHGEWWEEYWRGMPEFVQENLAPRHSIRVDFARRADVDALAKLVGQTITPHGKRTRSIWYPEAEIGRLAGKAFVTDSPVNPRYPVYIISKGRWDSRLTAKSLERMRVPYYIVVEPQEVERYASVIDRAKILELPFSNLGLGSIPARNWVWEHALASGASRHWILDDNIDGFYRLNRNLKTPCSTGAIFRAAEDFSDRYENVAISGFHYFMFASRKTKMPPFTLNSRVYSMILIRNDLPLRWRGRYNEDTDLSLRALKSGYCTVLFTAFLGMKATTMTMKGGNADELYKGDGRRKMAESLVEQHPDVARVTWKWGRWQHHVDYSSFRKNKLIERPGIKVQKAVDNYGMTLVDKFAEGES